MATKQSIHNVGTDLPEFKVFSNGEELGREFGLISILTSKVVNKIPTAQVVLEDGDSALQTFKESESDFFVPGTEIEIQGGYQQEFERLFKGIIIKHSIKTRGLEKASLLTLDVKDVTVKTTIGRKNKYFEESTDSDAIEEIIDSYGLEKDVESTDIEHQELVQYFSTDWDFIVSRAEVNGKLVFVDDGTITVKAPDLGQNPKLELTYGANIFDIEAEMDARDQYAAINSKSWSYADQEVVELEGADPGFTEQGNISGAELADVIGLDSYLMQSSAYVKDQELEAWSNAKFLRSRLAKIKGTVVVQGYADIKPGDMISLAGLGDRFNGRAFVSGVTQDFKATTNWYTEIQFGLDQKWFSGTYDDIVDDCAAGLVPAIKGLQVGIVTNIHEDPDGEDRVKVRIPVLDAENEGVWARVSTLDAGENRGSFFRPEINDEVIVGFLNEDPRDPIILGMVNSSAKPAPLTAEEDNNEKGFITRSEIKLLFDDDKGSVTIETPNGNTIILSDDEGSITLSDENMNKIEMTSDGINIESATGNITLSAAAGDITVEGLNVTNSATAQFVAEGMASADVTSSGVASLKGSTQTAIG